MRITKGGIAMNHTLAYEDEPREELIGGKIIAMSPRPLYNHNRVAGRIYKIFEDYLEDKSCTAIMDGTDLYLTENNRFVPDFMVVCDQNKIKKNGVHGTPDLVVEILSPSTSKRDRMYKKDTYGKFGVQEYWLVDPVHRSIEQYFLENGQLELREIYTLYYDYDLEQMNEEERAAVPTHFKCSLFDDLDIALADIFKGLIP